MGLCLLACAFIFGKSIEYREPLATNTTRALNTDFQIDQGRSAFVCYSVEISSSITITGGQSGTVTLQTSPDNITWTTQDTQTNNNTGTVVIGISTTNTQTAVLTGFVKYGYWVKIVSTGTSTFTYKNGAEVLL